MIEQLAAAMQQRDYDQARRLLPPLLKQQPQNPWVQLYTGQLQEVGQQSTAARKTYQKLLQTTTNPRVIRQARLGLARLSAPGVPAAPPTPDAAPAPPAPPPATVSEAILLLLPPDEVDRDRAIAAFATLMGLDRYTARTQLPKRGWRLQSTGSIASLEALAAQLGAAGIEAQVLTLEAIQAINVFRVSAVQQMSPPVVLCENDAGQQGTLAFTWPEVARWVAGRLPIFEEVVDRDARKRLMRKQQTQDYAYFLDIHLPRRRAILRLCDQTYQFEPAASSQTAKGKASLVTRQQQWQRLTQQLLSQHDAPLWSEFVPFGESAHEAVAMLPPFPSHIDLLRKHETPWDRAFHIYSSAAFYS
ncbi:MAG: tetratricopeptide repeat protein [Cyanobacteria bacterium P01_A01_bin.135]